MSECCGTAVSQSLLALTALRVLDLSSTAHRTLCPVLEHNVAISNAFTFTGNMMNSSAAKTLAQSLTALTGLQTLQLCRNND
jgi:hypothetical protein